MAASESQTRGIPRWGDLRTAGSRFCPKKSGYGIPPEFGATIVQGGPITESALALLALFQLAPLPGHGPKRHADFQKVRTLQHFRTIFRVCGRGSLKGRLVDATQQKKTYA